MSNNSRRFPVADPRVRRALLDLALGSEDADRGRSLRRVDAPAGAGRPRRLPAAIALEVPPNVLYRRYPLVTSLLAALDELQLSGEIPQSRRGR